MLFHYTGAVPANTTTNNPLWEKLVVAKGTIIQWVLFQPEECADLLKFWVVYHGTQILPFNPDEWAYGFFVPTKIDEKIELPDSPYILDFYAINEDDSYSHEYHVYVNVEPAEIVTPGPAGEYVFPPGFKEFFGGS